MKMSRIHLQLVMLLLISGSVWNSPECQTGASAGSGTARLEVKNSLDIARPEVVLELPLTEVLRRTEIGKPENIRVSDISMGGDLPTQLYSSIGDGPADTLLVLVSVGSRQTIRLRVHEAEHTPLTKPLVFGRPVPERMDDFAWENDKVAFRVYGPALQATGEISSGIDVWSKRVPDLIINDWYARDAEGTRTKNPALSYHEDNGQGMDGYKVGPSRGCGGTGIFLDGKLLASLNYTSVRIIAAGPIRFSFELKYAPWKAGNEDINESKRITLDAGSHLNRIESTMAWSSNAERDFATGLALHAGSQVSVAAGGRIVSVWESTSEAQAGMDATGIVWASGPVARRAEANGNTLLVTPARPGKAISYFAGQGWSEGDMPNRSAWNTYLQNFLLQQLHPLEIKWQ
jgi:pectinesterase